METVVAMVARRGSELLSEVESLLRDHSAIYQWNPPSSGVLHTSGDHAYRSLDSLGTQLQSKLFESYREFADLLEVLLKEQPERVRTSHAKHRKTVLDAIEQDGHTWHRSIEEEWAFVSKALRAQIDSVTQLYVPSDAAPAVVVPDTNALLWNPRLEDWTFESQPFDVCLVPVVLSELDSLKVNHRNEDVRQKAEGLIRRIKGYRDRGSLREGVTLRHGVSRIRSIAIEPDFKVSLPWLVADNADDRLVATFIEVMRKHPGSSVVLVTRDLNLQNKMELAQLPFSEPPDPDPTP